MNLNTSTQENIKTRWRLLYSYLGLRNGTVLISFFHVHWELMLIFLSVMQWIFPRLLSALNAQQVEFVIHCNLQFVDRRETNRRSSLRFRAFQIIKGHLNIDIASVKKSVCTCQNKDYKGNKMKIIVHENVCKSMHFTWKKFCWHFVLINLQILFVQCHLLIRSFHLIHYFVYTCISYFLYALFPIVIFFHTFHFTLILIVELSRACV